MNRGTLSVIMSGAGIARVVVIIPREGAMVKKLPRYPNREPLPVILNEVKDLARAVNKTAARGSPGTCHTLGVTATSVCHCEERSDEAIGAQCTDQTN